MNQSPHTGGTNIQQSPHTGETKNISITSHRCHKIYSNHRIQVRQNICQSPHTGVTKYTPITSQVGQNIHRAI